VPQFGSVELSNEVHNLDKGKYMKLINNSKNSLSHDKYNLAIGSIVDVPEEVAKLWLNFEGITQYYSADDIEAEKEKAVKAALKEVSESKPKTQTKAKTKKK